VEGHFHAKHPWYSYHEELTASSAARLVGAQRRRSGGDEPTHQQPAFPAGQLLSAKWKARKILTEQRPFPSDTYAFASQIAFHGGDPEVDLVEVQPRKASTRCGRRTSSPRSTNSAMNSRWSVSVV
jgi:kynureninase